MFGWNKSSSARNVAPGAGVDPRDAFDESLEVFQSPLPPTLPVVKKTIDALAAMATQQRVFLSGHADRVKLELVKERDEATLKPGSWVLNGFSLTDEDAVDLIRQSPDALSNLMFTAHPDTTSLWARLTSWLRMGNTSVSGMSVSDDLAFALSVTEVVEITGHTLAAVSYAVSAQTPKIGSPLERSLAFELVSSRHRGNSHSMYLCLNVEHTAQRAASQRTARTLTIASRLYVHTPQLLNGLRGVAVSTSGTHVDDLPTSDIDSGELTALLARKGTFVASTSSDFVLDDSRKMDSGRVATVALASCTRLSKAANAALSGFFDSEYKQQETARAVRRQQAREDAIAKAAADAERREEALQKEMEAARKAASQQQQQQQSQQRGGAQYPGASQQRFEGRFGPPSRR